MKLWLCHIEKPLSFRKGHSLLDKSTSVNTFQSVLVGLSSSCKKMLSCYISSKCLCSIGIPVTILGSTPFLAQENQGFFLHFGWINSQRAIMENFGRWEDVEEIKSFVGSHADWNFLLHLIPSFFHCIYGLHCYFQLAIKYCLTQLRGKKNTFLHVTLIHYTLVRWKGWINKCCLVCFIFPPKFYFLSLFLNILPMQVFQLVFSTSGITFTYTNARAR